MTDQNVKAAGPDANVAPGRRRFPWLVLLPLLIFGFLAAVFLRHLIRGTDPSRLPSVLLGRSVPEFNLAPIPGLLRDGKPVAGLNSAELKGGVSVINIWGSWCVECRDEHAQLMQLGKDKRVRLVGITWRDDPLNAAVYLSRSGNPFDAVGIDATGRTAIDFGVYGVPETYVVAADGTVTYKFIGPLTDKTLKTVLGPEIDKAAARKP